MPTYLTLKDVSYASSRGRLILSNINLMVAPHKVTTIIGPNGAGKTTLLKIMVGLVEPTAGALTHYKNTTLSYIPQYIDINPLIPLTVLKFLSLTSPLHTKKIDIHEALKIMKVCHLQNALFSNLSGGERQRVLIARALLKRPQLLILDEPTQAMDIAAQVEFYNFLNDYKKNHKVAIVLVSHDLHAVMAGSDQIICLNKHICCQGAPQDVMYHPEYQFLFGLAPYLHKHDHTHDNPTCEHSFNIND